MHAFLWYINNKNSGIFPGNLSNFYKKKKSTILFSSGQGSILFPLVKFKKKKKNLVLLQLIYICKSNIKELLFFLT